MATHIPTEPRASSERRLQDDDVYQGALVFIPPESVMRRFENGEEKFGVTRVDWHDDSHPESKVLKHPAVVLSRPADNPAIVHVVIMRSWANQGLTERILAEEASSWKNFLSMEPAPQHPFARTNPPDPLYLQLSLRHGLVQNKSNGYLNVGEIFCMKWRDLWTYPRNGVTHAPFVLSEESVEQVLSLTFELSTYIPGQQWAPEMALQAIEEERAEAELEELLADINSR